MRRISDQYFQPNLSIEEMHALWHSNNADPLKFFGQACRAELKSMQSAV